MRHADAALVQAAIELARRRDRRPSARASTRSPAAAARRPTPTSAARVDLRHRGAAYRFAVCQIAPGRYRVEVDGARIEVERRAR